MRIIAASTVCILISATLCLSAFAMPNCMNYQGKLTDGQGGAVPDGAYQAQFALYSVESGGTAFWTSSAQTVQTTGGLFTTSIGPLSADILASRSDVWLETSIGNPPKAITPRIKLGIVPFALVAGSISTGTDSGANVTVVSEGQSVQTAVTAAGTAYSVDGKWRVVLVDPGAYDETVTMVAGVILQARFPGTTFIQKIVTVPGSVVQIYPQSPAVERIPLPYAQDTTLVTIQSDDISDRWVNISADSNAAYGNNISAALYAAMNGIPVTHGLISGRIGGAGYLTLDQLRYLFWVCGHEMASQSYSHSTTPISVNSVMNEVVADKARIDVLSAEYGTAPTGFSPILHGGGPPESETYWERLGIVCRGFSNPGPWAYPGTHIEFLRTAEGRQSYLYEAIRSTYEWAVIYDSAWAFLAASVDSGFDNCWISVPGFIGQYIATPTNLEPGIRLRLAADGPGSDSMSHAQFKSLVDYLVAQRSLGKVQIVTGSTFRRGIIQPQSNWGGLSNWSIEQLPLDPVGGVSIPTGPSVVGLKGTGSVKVVPGQAAQVTNGNALIAYAKVRPGQSYCLRIKAQASAEASIHSIRPLIHYHRQFADNTDEGVQFYLPDIDISNAAETTAYRCFGVPAQASNCEIELNVTVDPAAYININSIELAPI